MRTVLALLVSCATCLGQFNPGQVAALNNPIAGEVTYSFIGGVPTNQWSNANQLIGGYTFLNDYGGQSIYHCGQAVGVHIWTTDASSVLTLRHWRPLGTNVFDHVQDILTTEVSTGTNYIEFPSPINVQEGDTIGLWWSNSAAKFTMSSPAGSRFSAGDQSSDGYSFTTPVSDSINLAIYGDSPDVVFAGDSIITGYPNAYGPATGATAPAGSGTNSPTWKMANEYSWTTPYANFAYFGKGFEWVNTNTMTMATNTTATTLFIQCGVNDVANGLSWSDVLTNLNSIRSKWSGDLIISEISPWTSGSDAEALTIRDWNTNLNVWCATSSATLFQIHDSMGTNRTSTSQLDDLKPEYDLDGVHFTTQGKTNYADRVVDILP